MKFNASTSTNFPLDGEGATYHVATKAGQVGDPLRARRIATLLDSVSTEVQSKRGFLTITGLYRNVQVSIISIGMGIGMMDMMVREVRAVVTGPILMIRFGSCGGIGSSSLPGQIAVADGAVMVTKNYDFWQARYEGASGALVEVAPYRISNLIPADLELSASLVTELHRALGEIQVLKGINATADSFYSSQGRLDPSFQDDNETLIDDLRSKFPTCETLEMESGIMLHLAQACNSASSAPGHPGQIRAAACAMIFFNRITNASIPSDTIETLESNAGKAVLEALIATSL